MPRTGQDPFNSAAAATNSRAIDMIKMRRGGEWGRVPEDRLAVTKSMERRMNTKRQVSSGEWGRVPEDRLAVTKSTERRMGKKREVSSGEYFRGNIMDRLGKRNQENIAKTYERMEAIKNRSNG